MFSFFSSAVPLTRFEACDDLKTLTPLINSLFYRETILKTASIQDNKSSLDQRKHRIVAKVCREIRQLQNDFNKVIPENTAEQEKLRVSSLINALDELISDTISTYRRTLNAHRDATARSLGRSVIGTTTKLGFISSGALLGYPIVSVAATAGVATELTSFITTPIQNSLFYVTGLSKSKKPKTMEIFDALAKALDVLKQKIDLEDITEESQAMDERHYPNNFICPLSNKLMKTPVVCTLDNITYEREAIFKWLCDLRQSPTTPDRMEIYEEINEVLEPNLELQKAIEEYNQKDSGILEKNHQSPTL